MPVDNFGRSFDALPTMEELLSPVKENKKEDEKRHEELADVLRSMSDKFEKGIDQLKKVTQNLFNLTQKDDKKEFAQNRNLNIQFQKLANDVNDNNKQINDITQKAGLQFQTGRLPGGGIPPGNRPRPANPPSPGGGGGNLPGAIGAAAGLANTLLGKARSFARTFDDILSPPDKLYPSLSQMLDFSGSLKQLNQFDISMKRLIYQTHGLTVDSEKVVQAFTDLKKVSAETGFDQSKLAGIMETYARKGMRTNTNLVKHAQTMQKIGRSQLFTERQLGLEAGTLTDHFSDLNIQANMSSLEIGTIAKSMRDVALNTGMTGKAMTEAIAGSKQFSNNLMNAGNLTANSLKNVTQMTANFKKFGADRAGEQIQSYLTDSNKLLLEGGDKMAMLVRQAADIGGVSQELLDGTITKSDKSMKKFSQGFKKMLNNLGVNSVEQFESLSDSVKAEINRNSQLMYGVSIGELLRADKALEESGKSFADRMKDISKEEEGMGKKTKKEIADLEKRKAEMKISRSLDIFGAIDKTAKGADVKSMADVFGKFGSITKEFDEDIAAILGVDAEKLKGAKGEDITFNLLGKTIEDLNKQLVTAGVKEKDLVRIDEKQLEQALKDKDVKKYAEIVEEIQAGQKRLTTKRLESQDPSSKALFDIQGNVDDLRTYFLQNKLQPGKVAMMERKTDAAGNEIPNSSKVDQIVDASSYAAKLGLEFSTQLAEVIVPGVGVTEKDFKLKMPSFNASADRGFKAFFDILGDFGKAADKATGGWGNWLNDFINPGSGPSNQLSKSGGATDYEKELKEIIEKNTSNEPSMQFSRSLNNSAQNLYGMDASQIAEMHKLLLSSDRTVDSVEQFESLSDSAKAEINRNAQLRYGFSVDELLKANKTLIGNNSNMDGASSAFTTLPATMNPNMDGASSAFTTLPAIMNPNMDGASSAFTTLPAIMNPNMDGASSAFTTLPAIMNPNMDGSRTTMPLMQRPIATMGDGNFSMDSSLFATNPRTQAQIANATSNKGQVFDYEERNSAEILKTLRQIRDDLKESKGSSSEDSSEKKFFNSRGGTKVDSKLGAINGGDYTSNDGIKAINY